MLLSKYTPTSVIIAALFIVACASGNDSSNRPILTSTTRSTQASAKLSFNESIAPQSIDGNSRVIVNTIAQRCNIGCVTDRVLLVYLSITGLDGSNRKYQIVDDGILSENGIDLLPN